VQVESQSQNTDRLSQELFK